MVSHTSPNWAWAFLGFYLGFMVQAVIAAPPPSVKDTMVFAPKQKDVEYEIPKPDEYAKCKVELEKKGKVSGWVVLGPAGQILRKFLDTDGDNKLDQWRYFNHGIEVYRDIDTNDNDKVDQSRWLNLGGSRYGIDKNEDGRIDEWRILSASEASKEAIRAVIAGDDAAFQAVLINSDDLAKLNMSKEVSQKILESASEALKNSKAIKSKSKVLVPQTRWSRFDANLPSLIPADDEKASSDLFVYENAMAILETGNERFAAVQIGEIIRVGEVWKLTQAPVPMEGDKPEIVSAGGILMQPLIAAANNAGPVGVSKEAEKILAELSEIEKDLSDPKADPKKIKVAMSQRRDLLKQAQKLAETNDERDLLFKQLIDGFALAAQMGTFPEGVTDLKTEETDLRKKDPKSNLISYVSYRRIQASYYVDMKAAVQDKDKAADVQKEWVKNLEEFATEFPNSDDAADAMLLLAHHEELSGRMKEAEGWYQKLVQTKGKTEAGQRAAGALHRINLKGQKIRLSGPGLDGAPIDVSKLGAKAVLVVFWASEYKVCEEDLPSLRALYNENRKKGLEIVGVSLDGDVKNVKPYLTKHQISWPQIYQPNGLSSPNAIQFGVISLPTMFLVNREGIVVSRNATVQEVKNTLSALLK
ncbi:MAG: redoxin domain-containing protein [Planctomycetes bacterium]|nr:redoxin domain-containing protein [Planctomycetota bacterium]